MGESNSQPSNAELLARINGLLIGLKWMVAFLMILGSLLNFFATYKISYFEQLITNTLPGRALPDLTLWLINNSRVLLYLTVFWPIVGVLLLAFPKSPRIWMIGMGCVLFFIGLQIALTCIGCFSPLLDLAANANG